MFQFNIQHTSRACDVAPEALAQQNAVVVSYILLQTLHAANESTCDRQLILLRMTGECHKKQHIDGERLPPPQPGRNRVEKPTHAPVSAH